MRFIKLLIFAFFLLFPVLLLGQGFPINRGYDVTESDAFQQTWDIAQDTSGVIYIAHGGGILKYDGVKWETKHGEGSKHVHRLHEGSDGSIYFGSENSFGYLIPDSLNRFTFRELSTEIPDSILVGDIYDIHESEGKIYFTSVSGFFVWDGNLVSHIKSAFELGRSFLYKEKIIVKRVEGELYLLNGEELTAIEGSGVFSQDYVYAFLEVDRGAFIAGRNAGFYEYREGRIRKVSDKIDPTIKSAAPYRAERLAKDRIALATLNDGVIVIDEQGEVIEKFNRSGDSVTEESIRNNMALGLMQDASGLLWIATLNGINKLNIELPVRYFGIKEGIPAGASSVQFYQEKVYIGTQEGLFTTELPLEWSSKFSKISDSSINELILNGNKLWIASEDGLKSLTENDQIRNWSDIPVLKAAVDEDKILFSDGRQIYQVSYNGQITTTGIRGNLFRISFNNGLLWLIDRNTGLRVFVQETLSEKEFSRNEIPESTMINFTGLINDTVRIATDAGLFKYQESLNAIISDNSFDDETLEQEQVHLFYQISEDTVWFRNNRLDRLFILNEDQWVTTDTSYYIFSEDSPPVDVTGNGNDFWIVSPREIKRFSETQWGYESKFKTNITGIYVNNDSLIYGGFGEPVQDLILPYKDNALRFTYAAASYTDETQNTYSVMLEGFDEDWSEWTPETQKDYTNIPEGEYVFKVRSKNVFLAAGIMDSIPFSVLPPWYRTWWAYLMYLAGISGVLYTAYRIRLNQLLKVERMRTRIAGDLHDEVSATLTGISYFAEAVKRDQDESRKEHFISLITESAGDAKEKITDIVWSINPENDDFTNFLAKCRRYASDLLESKEVEYQIRIPESYPGKLKMEYRQHIWMIFKEMITNAVRHSGATQLDVIMKIEQGVLSLVVQDNGNGFDAENGRRGNGISNIRRRAEQINATIDLNSEPDFGTRWKMRVTLP